MSLLANVRNDLVKMRCRPDPKESEFFCIDNATIDFISRKANLKNNEKIIELNPGLGFLTKKLLEKNIVFANEPNKKIFDYLNKKFKKEIGSKKLFLTNKKVGEINFDEIDSKKIVSFLPQRKLTLLFENMLYSNLKEAVVVLEKGFVDKMLAFEGFSNYSPLNAFLNLNAEIVVLKEIIEQDKFYPRTFYLSSMVKVSFKRKNTSKEFYEFLKKIFRNKNKVVHSKNKDLDGIKANQVSPEELLILFNESQ